MKIRKLNENTVKASDIQPTETAASTSAYLDREENIENHKKTMMKIQKDARKKLGIKEKEPILDAEPKYVETKSKNESFDSTNIKTYIPKTTESHQTWELIKNDDEALDTFINWIDANYDHITQKELDRILSDEAEFILDVVMTDDYGSSYFADEDRDEFFGNDNYDLSNDTSEDTYELKSELEEAISEFFGDDELKDYTHVEIDKSDDGRYKVEVGAELSYKNMSKLLDSLDKIVQKYDSGAYFDMEDAGIATAYVELSPIKTESFTEDFEEDTGNEIINEVTFLANDEQEAIDTYDNAILFFNNSSAPHLDYILASLERIKKDELEHLRTLDAIYKIVSGDEIPESDSDINIKLDVDEEEPEQFFNIEAGGEAGEAAKRAASQAFQDVIEKEDDEFAFESLVAKKLKENPSAGHVSASVSEDYQGLANEEAGDCLDEDVEDLDSLFGAIAEQKME